MLFVRQAGTEGTDEGWAASVARAFLFPPAVAAYASGQPAPASVGMEDPPLMKHLVLKAVAADEISPSRGAELLQTSFADILNACQKIPAFLHCWLTNLPPGALHRPSDCETSASNSIDDVCRKAPPSASCLQRRAIRPPSPA